MIKVEKTSNPDDNFISCNDINDDVAQFWFRQEHAKYFYFTEEQLQMEEGQIVDLLESGKVIIKSEADNSIIRQEIGIEGQWPYDEEMNFVGYGFNI